MRWDCSCLGEGAWTSRATAQLCGFRGRSSTCEIQGVAKESLGELARLIWAPQGSCMVSTDMPASAPALWKPVGSAGDAVAREVMLFPSNMPFAPAVHWDTSGGRYTWPSSHENIRQSSFLLRGCSGPQTVVKEKTQVCGWHVFNNTQGPTQFSFIRERIQISGRVIGSLINRVYFNRVSFYRALQFLVAGGIHFPFSEMLWILKVS